jgi:hypothetical protein
VVIFSSRILDLARELVDSYSDYFFFGGKIVILSWWAQHSVNRIGS